MEESAARRAQCRDKTARMAAVYHVKLCRAILVGFRRQVQKVGTDKADVLGMLDKWLETDQLPIYSLRSTYMSRLETMRYFKTT